MLWFFEVAKCYGGYFERKKIKGSERFRYFAYSIWQNKNHWNRPPVAIYVSRAGRQLPLKNGFVGEGDVIIIKKKRKCKTKVHRGAGCHETKRFDKIAFTSRAKQHSETNR